MSTFLYMQDGHFKGKNPGQRTDNYPESWLIKFQEFLDIGEENNVDAYLDGGDIFDIPNISNIFLDKIIDMIEQKQKPFYSLYGNHTMIGYNIEASKGTSLAHTFRRSKLIKYLDCLEGDNYIIKGIEYKHGIEEDIKENGIIVEGDKDTWKIAIVHALVTSKPFFKEVSHVVYNDVKTNCDLVLVAHLHQQYKKEVGDTTFLDIGNFGRCAISEHKIKPSCLLINTDKREFKKIELKTAKPGSEVFDLTKVEELKAFDNNINNFISSLQSTKVQSMSIRGIITDICKENKVEKEVEQLIIDKVGESE